MRELLFALVLPVLAGADMPEPRAPDPRWIERRPGDRRVFSPGFERPPLVLNTAQGSMSYVRGTDLTFDLEFRAFTWFKEFPAGVHGNDSDRLWVLVHDGRRTRVFRQAGFLDCAPYIVRRVRPGDAWHLLVHFTRGYAMGWVPPADAVFDDLLFPENGRYEVQFIYDQGEITAESNWLEVAVGGPR
jgi:hypothetical protein